MRLALIRLFSALAVLVALTATPAQTVRAAPEDQKIAAVVNDDVISVHDIDTRLALILATTNVEPTPEARQRLTPQVLRSLIDDALKRQEARRLNVVLSRAELDDALDRIGQQAKMTPEELAQYLARRGVAMSTLIEQVETEIGWIKAINRASRDQIRVSEEQVDEELARINENAGNPEFRVAEIFLPFDAGMDEARVAELAQRIVQEIASGARFPDLARNFSQGASAAVGGDLGWVRKGQLPEQLDAALDQLAPGQVSIPIRTQMGYHILAMIDRRISEGVAGGNAKVELTQAHFPLSQGASPEEVAAQVETARTAMKGATDCASFNNIAKNIGSPLSGSLGEVELRQLPPELRRVVLPLRVGEASPPIRGADGVVVVMVCRRDEEAPSADVRDKIEAKLREERISALAQRTLRDLRRTAYVDIRN
ncbi:MAG: peptidylprolyl isomerase [Rhodospirillales bacterium]|nr:peptidylprolyl isomerase [Rhodospirillales bacterium]